MFKERPCIPRPKSEFMPLGEPLQSNAKTIFQKTYWNEFLWEINECFQRDFMKCFGGD